VINSNFQKVFERFDSVIELAFLDTDQYNYYIGFDGDDPVQIKMDTSDGQKIFYRSPADEQWIEIVLDNGEGQHIALDHRDLMQMIADKFKEIFISFNVWENATIYFNGQAYMSGDDEVHEYVDPSDYAQTYNSDTVTVTYAEPLKTVMLYGIEAGNGLADYSVLLKLQEYTKSLGYRMSHDENGFMIYK